MVKFVISITLVATLTGCSALEYTLTPLEMILDEVCSDPTSYVSEAASYLANSVSDKHALVAV